MDFFLQNFIGYGVFGSALSPEIVCIFGTMSSLLVLYVYYRGIKGIVKWLSFNKVHSNKQLEFEKAKWDAMENKRLLRMGAHVGWDGIGANFEHDNRRG